ncbi:MAG TPA: hypothetical protein VHD57_11220 [Vicinamibacterales bacterium]|jgi:hypothetical protein|nr:hypothetical protein [Vicinamibacterales bacterium]
MQLIAVVVLLLLQSLVASAQDRFQSPQGDSIGDESLNRLEALSHEGVPILGQKFWYDDHGAAYQCGGSTGISWARLGDWTPDVRINTDDGWGGCLQSFALLDPSNSLSNLKLTIDFSAAPDSDAGQCGEAGEREIIKTATQPAWSRPYRIDTDSRKGGCRWTMSMSGRSDIEVRVKFFPDDQGVGQCGENQTRGPYTPNRPEYLIAKAGEPLTLDLDTDGRWGGCVFSLQLVKTSPN